jgi:hypothetical protein
MSNRHKGPKKSLSPTSTGSASESGAHAASSPPTAPAMQRQGTSSGPSTLVGITASTKEDWSVDFDLTKPLVMLRGGGGGTGGASIQNTPTNLNDRSSWDGKQPAPNKVHQSSRALLQGGGASSSRRSSDVGLPSGNSNAPTARPRPASMRQSRDWKLPVNDASSELPPRGPPLETLLQKTPPAAAIAGGGNSGGTFDSGSLNNNDQLGGTSGSAREGMRDASGNMNVGEEVDQQRLLRERVMLAAGVNPPPSPMLTGRPLPHAVVTPNLDWSQEHGRAQQILSRLLSRGSVHFDTGDRRW